MGFREYARHRKVTLSAVQKAIAAGRIPVVVDQGTGARKIDAAAADLAWVLNTDPAAQSLLYSAGPRLDGAPAPLPAAPGAPEARDEDELPNDSASPEYRQARARREEIRRDKEQIELDRLRGSVIALADAQHVTYTAFRALRDGTLQVPARVKDECAARSDPFEIEQLIEAELTAVFLRFDPEQMLRLDPDDDDEIN